MRTILALTAALALSGCAAGSPDEPEEPAARAHLRISGEEGYTECPPLTVRRLERQPIAFSGTLRLERPSAENPDHVDWAIDVDHWYSPEQADVMVIHASDVALQYFSGTVAAGHTLIEDGERLLVAGPDTPRGRDVTPGPAFVGSADSCLTRRWSEDLAEQYERAFPG